MNRSFLTRIRPRTAWLVLLGCAALWTAGAFNLLQPPAGTPPMAMLLFLYFALIAVILSFALGAGAAAILYRHYRAAPGTRNTAAEDAGARPPGG